MPRGCDEACDLAALLVRDTLAAQFSGFTVTMLARRLEVQHPVVTRLKQGVALLPKILSELACAWD